MLGVSNVKYTRMYQIRNPRQTVPKIIIAYLESSDSGVRMDLKKVSVFVAVVEAYPIASVSLSITVGILLEA